MPEPGAVFPWITWERTKLLNGKGIFLTIPPEALNFGGVEGTAEDFGHEPVGGVVGSLPSQFRRVAGYGESTEARGYITVWSATAAWRASPTEDRIYGSAVPSCRGIIPRSCFC